MQETQQTSDTPYQKGVDFAKIELFFKAIHSNVEPIGNLEGVLKVCKVKLLTGLATTHVDQFNQGYQDYLRTEEAIKIYELIPK